MGGGGGGVNSCNIPAIQFCNSPRSGFYPLKWSRFEEGVHVFDLKTPTRKSLV